ncbi:MAG: hypothetical protein QOE45_323 [Frankiaceae bacterium]|jgi:hypothetical protein|nr:hypothetical protein [Frankiaceae bacterium]
MQLRRFALAVLVLGVALPTVPAIAAAKPKPLPCKQISDDPGDGRINPLGLSSPALDILSADVSSGRNEVTATLRLKSAAVENDNYLRGGAIWNFNVTVSGTNYSFYARWPSVVTVDPPALYGGLTAGSNQSSPVATFRRVGNDFVWTVSRAAINGLKKPKTSILVTGASSNADSLSADSAPAKPDTKYLDKTPTCLPSK